MSVKKVLAHTLIASAVLASPLIPATEWKAGAKAVQKQTCAYPSLLPILFHYNKKKANDETYVPLQFINKNF